MDSKPPNSRALLRHLRVLLISNGNCRLATAAVYPPRTPVNPLEDSIRWLKGVPWPHYSFKSRPLFRVRVATPSPSDRGALRTHEAPN